MYVVECRDHTLYTGITTNLQRRLAQHNRGKGAAYTAARRPVSLRAAWTYADRSQASQAEAAFKRQSRVEKLARIETQSAYRDGPPTALD